jgi:hypothetical protein
MQNAWISISLLTNNIFPYIEYHSVCPLVEIGTPPLPIPQASEYSPPPPETKRGGGAHSPVCGGGGGGVPIPTTGENSLALGLLGG